LVFSLKSGQASDREAAEDYQHSLSLSPAGARFRWLFVSGKRIASLKAQGRLARNGVITAEFYHRLKGVKPQRGWCNNAHELRPIDPVLSRYCKRRLNARLRSSTAQQ